LLEEMWDPWTISNLEKVGVGDGWRCLEVAGGGGSIAAWLRLRVGTRGHVVATDLQPHFLEALRAPNLEVWRHDLIHDSLPAGTFDLVHARAVLTFLPRSAEVLSKLVASLKPGGWLLTEEPEYVSGIPDPSMDRKAQRFSEKAWEAMLSQIRSEGYDTDGIFIMTWLSPG
jgi:trans-aconitate methyltransferase